MQVQGRWRWLAVLRGALRGTLVTVRPVIIFTVRMYTGTGAWDGREVGGSDVHRTWITVPVRDAGGSPTAGIVPMVMAKRWFPTDEAHPPGSGCVSGHPAVAAPPTDMSATHPNVGTSCIMVRERGSVRGVSRRSVP